MSPESGACGVATQAALRSLDRIARESRPGIWIEVLPRERVLAAAAAVDAAIARDEYLPLAGLTLAVKGNVAVEGFRNNAACPSYGEVALESAPSVRALEAAGAVVVGITNLDQFATGLVGTRSPYGVCPNAFWPELISGGSSSGSAVAVALGLVDLSIGTDTAGSGRVPAAANGIVGVKPTRGWVTTVGVVPACRSLDCVSFFAADVSTAALAARIAGSAEDDPTDGWRRRPHWPAEASSIRVGFPAVQELFFDGDPNGPGACVDGFEIVRDRLADASSAGVLAPLSFTGVDLAPFVETGALLYEGAFVAERYDAVGEFIDAGSDDLDPVVAGVISRSGSLPASRLFRDLDELARRRRSTGQMWHDLDVMVVPSVPRIPTVDQVQAAPIEVNSMLGVYTNFVNLLDLAAVTVPVGPVDVNADGPPFSVTLIGPAWSDELLVALADAIAPRSDA